MKHISTHNDHTDTFQNLAVYLPNLKYIIYILHVKYIPQ